MIGNNTNKSGLKNSELVLPQARFIGKWNMMIKLYSDTTANKDRERTYEFS